MRDAACSCWLDLSLVPCPSLVFGAMFGFGASPVVEAGLGFTPFAGVARCSSVCSVDSGLHALVVSAPGSGVFLLCGLIAAFLLASAGGSLTGGP